MDTCKSNSILLLESFYGGSHKQLIDLLHAEIPNSDLVTLPAKKWHWRSRAGALCLANQIPRQHTYRILFTTAVFNLAELVALRKDLAGLHKILYFHENQLVYPKQEQKERDFQHGYNQILSCLVADQVVFNSKYNMQSFLDSIGHFLKMIPDHRPKNVADDIRPKCKVLYFPIKFPAEKLSSNQAMNMEQAPSNTCPAVDTTVKTTCEPKEQAAMVVEEKQMKQRPLHIVWPHRWEYDKDPETFFRVMCSLDQEGMDFSVSVLGEEFDEVPEIFQEAKVLLQKHITHWGYQQSKDEFYDVLRMADVVVSTARHEFFGVAVLEAVFLGCFPFCPNRLVYPEIFPKECLYNTDAQLHKNLRNWCKHPNIIRRKAPVIDCTQYSWTSLQPEFRKLFETPDEIS